MNGVQTLSLDCLHLNVPFFAGSKRIVSNIVLGFLAPRSANLGHLATWPILGPRSPFFVLSDPFTTVLGLDRYESSDLASGQCRLRVRFIYGSIWGPYLPRALLQMMARCLSVEVWKYSLISEKWPRFMVTRGANNERESKPQQFSTSAATLRAARCAMKLLSDSYGESSLPLEAILEYIVCTSSSTKSSC